TLRLLLLALLAAVAGAYLLLKVDSLDGASDDLIPPWVLARLAVTGHRADSYDLSTQLAVIRPQPLFRYWLVMKDSPQIAGIGLCPYPPTVAVVYAPLGLLPFDTAGVVVYFASIALAVVAAGAISRATAGRVIALA